MTTAEEKRRWPRAIADEVAQEIVVAMKWVCERILIAGSLRRRKETVGDVEILYIAKFKTVQDGFFDTAQIDLAEGLFERMLEIGYLRKRPSVKGTFAWGNKNKLGIHCRSGIPVDFFATTPEAWYNYLVCRTGPADSNKRIAMTAQKQNHTWHPYDVGFENNATGEIFPMHSEREVFAFLGLPYYPPEERT
jgi:DNA polymerase/3'-5' exonuclease PolX